MVELFFDFDDQDMTNFDGSQIEKFDLDFDLEYESIVDNCSIVDISNCDDVFLSELINQQLNDKCDMLESIDIVDNYNDELFASSSIAPYLAEKICDRCDFESGNWDYLSDSEKMEQLNQLEANLAKLEGRNAVEIQMKDMDSFTDIFTGRKRCGFYDSITGEIYINSSILNSVELFPKVIDTVIHEGIHAYQHQCVSGNIEHYNLEEVMDWEENFRNYKPASLYGMEIYLNQPVELFARVNATKIADSLSSLI